jgi:hypothetical protein
LVEQFQIGDYESFGFQLANEQLAHITTVFVPAASPDGAGVGHRPERAFPAPVSALPVITAEAMISLAARSCC